MKTQFEIEGLHKLQISNSNIVDNSDIGLVNYSGSSTAINSIFYNNSNYNEVPVQIAQYLGSTLIDYSIVQNYENGAFIGYI